MFMFFGQLRILTDDSTYQYLDASQNKSLSHSQSINIFTIPKKVPNDVKWEHLWRALINEKEAAYWDSELQRNN